MIDFSNREVKTVVKFKEQKKEVWFEIRYLSQKKMESFKTDLEMFQWVVMDWGDDFKSPAGKDWDCTEKCKEEFYWEIPDLTAKVLLKSFDKFTFATDTTEVINRLGKSQNIKESGDKLKQPPILQTVIPA